MKPRTGTRMSLRRQFLVAFVTFAVVVAAGMGWTAWRLTSGALEREMDTRLTSVAGAFAAGGLQAEWVMSIRPGDERLPDNLGAWWTTFYKLEALSPWVDEAYLFLPDNRVLVSTEGQALPVGSRLRWPESYPGDLERAWRTGSATTDRFLGEDGRPYKYGLLKIDHRDVMLGVLIQTDFLAPLERLRRTLLVGTIVATLVAALIAAVLAGTVARPLERLSRVALRIQRGRMTEPVFTEPGYELGRLSRAMERMRRGIARRDEQLTLMLAQVAHEIRNPLGGLELFTSAAAETEDPEERARLLNRVRSEITDLNDIIDDFLAFARPVEPGPELHDVRNAVRQAGELVEMELEKKGGRLRMKMPETPLLARADPEHVKRVVLNLIRNAADAGNNVEVEGLWINGEVVVAVRDDGPGVPEELRERIFEPFVSEKEKGAGLGLAIVDRVTRANGGRVRLMRAEEREAGWGAEFRVYFTGSEEFPTWESASTPA